MAENPEAIKAALAEMMQRNREAPDSGNQPPGLSVAKDPAQSCQTCVHWLGGMCTLYQFKTQPTQVCESWETQQQPE